jgi:multidrug efflux pump subunit AcrB
VVGDFFKALSITLSVAVLISMFLALYVIPFSRAVVPQVIGGGPEHTDRRGAIDRWYASSLPVFLKRPALALLVALMLAAGAVAAFLPTGTGFLPVADEGGFVVDY